MLGMGGAMDLEAGAKRVIVAMTHATKGNAKIVASLAFPMTADRRVDLIVTEKAVIQPTKDNVLLIPDELPQMRI